MALTITRNGTCAGFFLLHDDIPPLTYRYSLVDVSSIDLANDRLTVDVYDPQDDTHTHIAFMMSRDANEKLRLEFDTAQSSAFVTEELRSMRQEASDSVNGKVAPDQWVISLREALPASFPLSDNDDDVVNLMRVTIPLVATLTSGGDDWSFLICEPDDEDLVTFGTATA